uniref:Cytochrome P450 n=1 Tax=Meloidogyne javanica TaxID=6303 RepID=A0A915M293_MELJA
MHLLDMNNLVTSDLDLIKQVFIKDFVHFPTRSGFPLTQNKKIIQNSLLRSMVSVVQGDDWRRVRNTITPAFTAAKLKKVGKLSFMIIPTISESCNELINYISCKYVVTNEEIPLKEIFGLFTIDVIGRSGFSSDFKTFSEEENEIVKQALLFSKATKKMAFFAVLTFFPTIKELLENYFSIDLWDMPAQKFFHGLMSKLYDERKDDPEAKDKFNDIFQLLMNAVNDTEIEDITTEQPTTEINNNLITKQNDKYLSKIELFAQGFMLLIAGYDTTASVLQFATYMLALHPKIQEKLREEINSVLGINEDISYEHLKKMDYLQAFLQETLRMYPPAPVYSNRACNTNLNLNGINLREGDLVTIPIYSIQHNEEFYTEPEEFKPERFIREEKASVDPLTFLAFGLGPRNCLGMRFAEIQMQVVIAHLVRRFKFKPSQNSPRLPLELESVMLLRPKKELVILAEDL